MYDHILVPVDGSSAAADAVDHAASLAAIHGAELHLVHVVEPQVAADAAGVDIVSVLEESGREALADAEASAASVGVETVTTELLEGQAHREIVEYAETNDVDLIVMGTHGRTGLGRLLLGSVAENVVRTSPVPVLTTREHPDDAAE
jgi:nucleotide-binding universal stress UspA family protein